MADAIENTVALDGQTTTTTDNAILRYDSGNTKFEGVTISASQIVGRSATGDTRSLSAATARQTIGLGTAAATNDKLLAFSSSSNQFVETAYTNADVANVTGVITTEGDLMVGDGSGDESRLAIGSNNRVLRSNGTTASWGQVQTADIATDAVTASEIAAGAVDTSEIASGAVTTTEIASNTIAQGDIANSAIGQGELKTATADTGTGTISPGTIAILSLTGGGYSHWAVADGNAGNFYTTVSTSSSNFTIELKNDSSGDRTAILHERYHSASRPYDMGDGIVGAFVSVIILPDGTVDAVSIAPDPVWANSGPTDIRPDWTDKATGKKYKRLRRPAITRDDVGAGRADMADYVAAMREAEIEDVEIDFAFKNADMHLFPHSWVTPPQGTICLLDPVNTFDLLMLHEAGEDVADLIHKGYIKVGDKVNRKGPPGVTPVSWKWK